MKASEHSNMKAIKSPSQITSNKHVGDFSNDRFSTDVKSPISKTQEHSNLDGGDLTDLSTSSKMSNPFFLQQKRCLGRKPSKLSKSRKRSTMSVIKEAKFELHSGDYFRGSPPHQMDSGHRPRRTMTSNKVTFDTKVGHFPLAMPICHPRSSIEDIKDRSGPSLESLGICKDELDLKNVCAPPKKSIHDALYQRVATFINPDISVIIDSYEFLCHKIVLQCYSEYFEELKNHSEVAVEGVTKGAFISIYNWMLAPGLEGLRYIQKNNILEVLIASKILIIKELENQCLAFIDSKEAFSEANAYLLFVDASRRQQTEIMELMVPRIQIFFLVLVSTVEFTELEVDDLCTILQSNYIVVHCEIEVFMAAVKWLMAKWEDRAKLLGIVMKCIRFGLMTPAQLVDIRKNPMSPEFVEITNDKTVQLLIEDGLAYSVESGLTGSSDHHAQRCELLKLKIPEPRNWANNSKEYKSYGDFINYLDEIAKNPKSFYADIRKDCASNDLDTFANEGYSSSSSSDGSFNSKIQVHARVPLNAGSKKPSLSDLLCKEKPKQNAKYSNVKHENTDQKSNFKSGRIQDEKITFDWRLDKTSMRPNKNSKDFIVQSHVTDKPNGVQHSSSKRISLMECAAIIIQATWRGYRERKTLRKVEPKSQSNSKPAKKIALENMFLCMKSNSDWEHALSDGNFSVVQRNGRKLKTKTTLTRSSSNESNDSIISVKEGPAYHKKPLLSSCEKSVLLFGGISPLSEQSHAREARQLYKYSLESNSWDKVDSMPSPRYYHSSSILRGKVYIVGGCNPNNDENGVPSITNENFSYDVASRVWSKEPGLKTPRKSCGLVTFDNHLYAIGGQDKNEITLASVERYDPQRRIWEEVAPIPEPTVGAAICIYKNQIWVAGGMSGNTNELIMSKDVWCYDPRLDEWEKKPQLRFGRAFAALSTFENNLVLVGGFTCENDGTVIVSNDNIDVWDGKNMMWKLKGQMNIPRHGHTITFLGSMMMLMGGVTSKSSKGLTQVETLDMLSGSRSRHVAPLPVPLVGHSTVLFAPLND